MDGYYSLPAGHVDGGETISDACRRELREEAGIDLSSVSLTEPDLVMHRIISPSEERVDFFYVITDWPGEPKNTEPEKCAGLEWIDPTQLPKNMVPYIRRALEALEERKRFVEFDQ